MKRFNCVLAFCIFSMILLASFVAAQTYEKDEVTGASVAEVPESQFPYNALASLLLILAVLVGSMFALRE